MKSVSKIMYGIGIVVNVIALITMITLFALLNASKGLSDAEITQAIANAGQSISVAEYRTAVNLLVNVFLVLLILETISFVFAIIGIVLAGKGTLSSVLVHILMIVFGIIGINVFYIIGAIFGLVKKEGKSTSSN